jgi:hypothetical protein|uniref:Uncharacterized protein n=1 Tax=Haptolina ericina TaxID=156174 RepID=A0A7S3B3B7_9EUKA|mmetsp:Transcript_49211/g.110680  ORF Transcript_49211/g.110680 Transcript_49211/m.110680 type:complete len:152 (+) Transcript_49211:20-475(+)
MDVGVMFSNLCADHPMLVSCLAMYSIWWLARYANQGRGVQLAAPGAKGATKEEAVLAARERQQKRLEAVTAARGQPAPVVPVAAAKGEPPAPTVAPTANPTLEAARKSANDKESYTQRLARLEKGKGASDTNPLAPAPKTSSHVVCRKKGG